MSIAVYCHTDPVVPDRRPMKKQSMPTFSPGRLAWMWRGGGGGEGLRS
jgi:hypothetical protein